MLLRNRMKCWYRYCATLVLVVLLAFALIGDASAATYDFANLGVADGNGFKPQGNRFLVSGLFAQEASPNDTTIYYNNDGTDVSGITIKADGVNLISFDLTDMDFIYYIDETVTSITITGTKTASAGGGTVTATIYPGSGSTNGHFTLSGKGASLSNFTSLTQLQFHVVMGDQNVACLDFATITLANEVHEVIYTPTVQASAMQAYKTGDTEVALNWTKGNGNSRLVFAKQGVTSGVPTLADSTTYTSNADFSAATDVGDGWKCVYSGNADYAMISGLSATTQYRFAVFEYNGYSGAEKYLQTTPATLNQSTLGSLGTWTSGDISTLNAENFWTWTDADRDSSGNTYVAHQYSDTSGQMQVQKWNGTAWSTLTSFTPASAGYGSFSDNSSIAVTGPDQFRLAILGVHGSPTATSWGVVQAKYDGSAWSYQDVETTSTVNRTYSTPLIAVDGSGNSHILYEYVDSASSPQVQQIKLASWNGSSWGYQTFSSISNYNSNNQVNKDYLLLNDASNKQHVFYFQQISTSSTALHYWTNSSGAWIDTTIFTGNTDSPRRLYGSFDSSGKLHVTFTNNAFLGKVVMYLTNKSGSWVTQPLMSPGLGYDKGYTALELRVNGSGDIVIPLRLTTSTAANDAFKVLLKKGTNPWYVSTLSSAAPDYEDASNSYSITGVTFRDDGKVMIAYANALASRPRKLMYSLAELAGNTAPTLAANNGLTLSQTTGETTITTAKLQVTDVEQAAAALTYTVGTAPTKGTLKKSGTALVATNTFTQDDIDNNRITYTPNGTLNGADSFAFTVSDGAGGSIGSTSFAITITDNVAPTVTSVTVPSNATYATGQNLDFTVNFSETVAISGTDSTLGLTVGSTARTAVYLSKTATSITYRYAVQSGDNDSDGITVGSLTLNGTTINDGASNTAIVTLNSVGSTTLVLVDSVAPNVSSVSVPSDATYKIGANLDFTVNFSENVTVNIVGGTPYIPITLNTGGTVHAAYVSGSGSSALVFRYTIVSGNSDPDGITVGSSITANGGTIRDAAANDAALALNSVASTTLVLVDAIAPAVTSVAVPINATYIAGQTLDFTINFSKAVTVTGIDSTLGLTIGSTARTAAYLSKTATSITYRYTVQNGDADSGGVTVGVLTLNTTTIKDAVGNDAALTLNSVGITTGVLVDAIVPNVTSVTVPANATYTTGQNLDFIVNWSENVTVTGTDSTLGLTIGSTVRTATYVSKTATSTTYRYTVQNGDIDSDGITVGALSLNTTTIKDSVGNDATLTLNSIGVTTGVLVDSMIPTAASATSVTATGFTANWSSVSGATSYYLDVATDNGFTSFATGYSNRDVSNVTSVAVTGLAANTTYYYRVRAYGASGTSGSSGVITTLTATSSPVAAAATAISFSGFTANWNSVTGATGYYLDVATNDSFTNFVTDYENKDVGNVTSKTVTGLTTATTYYYRVRAYNSGGTGDNSNAISLTTSQNRIVTTANDSGPGSLRQTISDSNSGDVISFDSSLNGQTITLTSGQLSIGKSMTIDGLTTSPGIFISGNDAVRVFYVSAGTVTINNLTIQNGNSVPAIPGNIGGAGLFVTNAGTAVTLNNCAVLNNHAANPAVVTGGGIVVDTAASLAMNNCTVSGNSSTFDAGGILNLGTLNINNGTIVSNSTPGAGGGLETTTSTVTLRNTILAGNSGSTGADCYTPAGMVQSAGYNMIGSTSSCAIASSVGDVMDFSFASLLLGPLQNNGGPNLTYALLPGSPAIDAIPGCNSAPATDQRGVIRPQGAACDIGAFESQGFILTKTGGDSQSTTPNTAFTQPLTLTVTANNAGEPVNNGVVTFSGPSAGASTNPVTSTATITNGAVSLSVTANGTVGSFNVTASAGGVATSAQFALTNLGVPDLAISASDGGVSITPGGTIAYTLSYSNAGNQGVAGVVVSETVPANTTFNAAASTTGWSCANGAIGGTTCNYTVGSLAAGASGSLTFAVTVALPIPDGVTQISNTVSIADNGINGADPNPGNNSGSDTTTVNKLNTTTTLNSSANPATYGHSVTFSAQVTSGSGTPTGTVTFKDNGTTIPGCGAANLDGSGQATCSTATLTVGTHSIAAVYSGDASFSTSTSSAVSQAVNQASFTIGLNSSINPSTLGQSVAFTATVPSGATGTVNFKDGTTSITGCSAVTISDTTATCSITSLAVGAHSITASYGGDTNYAGSTSTVLTQTVSLAPAFTSGNSSTFTIGTAGTFTVTATSYPAPTLSLTTGTLPSGITFDAPSGVLSGTPAVGTNGTYNITFTASNGVSSTTTQNFTLTVAFNVNPPALTISTLPDGTVTTSSVLNISGTATGANGIQSLAVNGAAVTFLSDGSFSYPVQLIAGDNTITTIATDAAGTTVSDIRTITLDSTAPVLTVTSPVDNKIVSQANVTVTGTIGDQSTTVTWSVNGSAPQAASQNGLTYSFSANLNGGINTIQITATGTTGAKSHIKRSISYQPVFSLAVTDPATDIRTPLGNYTLTGSVADNSTAVTITISMDGQTYNPTVTNGIFQQQLPFSSEKIYQIGITGTDQNSTSLTVQRNIIHTTASSSYTVADALLALQAAVGTATPTASQILMLDVAPMVNGVSVGDGKIGGDDALMILRMAVGLIQ